VSGTGFRVEAGPLSAAQAAAVVALAGAAAEADGVAPLSEHGLLRVRHPGETGAGAGTELLALTQDGEIAGYAYLDPPEPAEGGPGGSGGSGGSGEDDGDMPGELVVHPARRRRGAGTALLRAMSGRAAAAPGGPRTIRVWAHGDLDAAAGLARSAGFARVRALWQMRATLDAPPSAVSLPAGITLRTFRPGVDEGEWLALNGRAFAKHAEQGAWTMRDVELREREPWFDPDGFFIAERDHAMVAFHWTKIHTAEQAGDGAPIGEVYVVGVDPDAHGGGIGRAITAAGLNYLRDRGLKRAMLYVDEDNTAAIRVYSSLGFTRWRADAMYRGLVIAG
jgi:mycothiol synthase